MLETTRAALQCPPPNSAAANAGLRTSRHLLASNPSAFTRSAALSICGGSALASMNALVQREGDRASTEAMVVVVGATLVVVVEPLRALQAAMTTEARMRRKRKRRAIGAKLHDCHRPRLEKLRRSVSRSPKPLAFQASGINPSTRWTTFRTRRIDQSPAGDSTPLDTNASKCSANRRGTSPPSTRMPSSMFLSTAEPVKLAEVTKAV